MRFEDALLLAGLTPKSVIADDRWHRCATENKPRKRNGAYRLAADGCIGWFRDWAMPDGIQTWRSDEESEVRRIDPAQIRASRERERAKRIAAMRSARQFWAAAQPMKELHPYLAAKRLSAQGCGGLRLAGNLLTVPVWHGEWIVSVQTIAADGQKRFWPGAPVKAGCYLIERKGAALTVICEGLATGLAVYQSMRSARVVVCFDAGNMLPVVERIKPSGAVVIAADNDHETAERIGVNPGIKKAQEAAQVVGCGIAFPEGIQGSDWADALVEWAAEPQGKWDRPLLPHRRIERLIQSQLAPP